MIDHDLVTFYLTLWRRAQRNKLLANKMACMFLQIKRKLEGKLMLLIKVRTSGPYVFRYWEYFLQGFNCFQYHF